MEQAGPGALIHGQPRAGWSAAAPTTPGTPAGPPAAETRPYLASRCAGTSKGASGTLGALEAGLAAAPLVGGAGGALLGSTWGALGGACGALGGAGVGFGGGGLDGRGIPGAGAEASAGPSAAQQPCSAGLRHEPWGYGGHDHASALACALHGVLSAVSHAQLGAALGGMQPPAECATLRSGHHARAGAGCRKPGAHCMSPPMRAIAATHQCSNAHAIALHPAGPHAPAVSTCASCQLLHMQAFISWCTMAVTVGIWGRTCWFSTRWRVCQHAAGPALGQGALGLFQRLGYHLLGPCSAGLPLSLHTAPLAEAAVDPESASHVHVYCDLTVPEPAYPSRQGQPALKWLSQGLHRCQVDDEHLPLVLGSTPTLSGPLIRLAVQ